MCNLVFTFEGKHRAIGNDSAVGSKSDKGLEYKAQRKSGYVGKFGLEKGGSGGGVAGKIADFKYIKGYHKEKVEQLFTLATEASTQSSMF